MSRFFVRIQRDGFEPLCMNWSDDEEPEYFMHRADRIWGIVEASDAEDAMAKLVDHAYENDLWYSIGGSKAPPGVCNG
jgi:hypothetical protein